MRMLWEILVPALDRDGEMIDVAYHRRWDRYVEEQAGGMTLLKPTRGTWVGETGTVIEPMIPVRIVCDESTIEQIIAHTIVYYDQEAVLAYRLSADVRLRRRDELTETGAPSR